MSKKLEEEYPSVDLAYDLAVRSYDLAVSRADSVDSKIQSLISLSCALTFAIPIAARSLGLDMNSRWFAAILLTFAATVLVGIVGRFFLYRATLHVTDPGKLYENNLHQSEWEFKKDFIYYAGASFEKNTRLVDGRWRCAVLMSFLLAAEALWMAAWVARS